MISSDHSEAFVKSFVSSSVQAVVWQNLEVEDCTENIELHQKLDFEICQNAENCANNDEKEDSEKPVRKIEYLEGISFFDSIVHFSNSFDLLGLLQITPILDELVASPGKDTHDVEKAHRSNRQVGV